LKVEREILEQMLRKMLEIRFFEERVADLYARGAIPGVAHLYVGEEAVAVGACSALRKTDFIGSTHRGHGHLIAKGGDLKRMMAELFSKKTGYSQGRGGSMHIASLDVGILGAEGIVGSGISIAVGAALAAKIKQTDQVALSFFGDGASDHGFFHEGLNFASVLKAPVIFVCENNLYAIGVSRRQSRVIEDIADRATSYGMPGLVVDGNDVIAVYEAVEQAASRARQGNGPTLVECKTYRWRGHHEGDPGQGERYRTKEEIAQWKQKDPIKRFKEKLLEDKILTEPEIQRVESEALNQVEEAVAYADQSPFPKPEEVLSGVFAD
jgi:pyruvate dehydrogenase E1 component alpha subunit